MFMGIGRRDRWHTKHLENHTAKASQWCSFATCFQPRKAPASGFEARIWPNGRHCQHCGSTRTHEAGHNHMPYRFSDCRGYFSVKTGTVMHKSHIPLRKWAFAIYLHLTSLKGVSSMKLHRDIGVSQPAAWFMLQRIRQECGFSRSPVASATGRCCIAS